MSSARPPARELSDTRLSRFRTSIVNLFSLLDQTARRHAERGAVFVGEEQRLSWTELHERALRLAAGIAMRCRPGDRVAVVSENRAEYLELMFAAWAAEAVLVPINFKLHDREVGHILGDADPGLVFMSPGLEAALPATLEAFRDRAISIGGLAYVQMLSREPAPLPVTDPRLLAWLFYTSGTTGRSKGAMLSHGNLLAMTVAHLADVEVLGPNCSQLHAAPLSHGSGMYVLPSVARAARQVLPASGGFDALEFLALCEAHPGCGAFLAPTMVRRVRTAAEAVGKLPCGLRSIVYGGGPMHVEELRKARTALGSVFSQIYGQGESPMTVTCLDRDAHESQDAAVLGSVGWPRSGIELRVVDAQGRPLPPGGEGEIVCRGDVVMSGYWGNPVATAETLRHGWLHTGDIGVLDERGCLTLRDRCKDVVISGGSNIYPREVEEVLLVHPGVASACVVGRPDREWGEVVVAFVVGTPGRPTSAAELDAHCLRHIARFKRPKQYRFVEQLPINGYGKVMRTELRAWLAHESPPDPLTP